MSPHETPPDGPAIPTARDIMSRNLHVLRPDQNAREGAELLIRHDISGAPVVDEDGRLLGVFSEFDCLRAVASSQYEGDWHDRVQTVSSLMSGDVHVVSPETDLYALAHELVTRRIRRLPVVENGKLVGQVSRRDVFRAIYRFRERMSKSKGYPDYPEGRRPIGDYPRD